MEAKLNEILTEIKLLRDEQQETRALVEQLLIKPAASPPRADDLVGPEYIQERTSYARRTILEGKAGLSAIPRMSVRPARWRRADVDAFLERLAEQKRRQERPRLLRRKRR